MTRSRLLPKLALAALCVAAPGLARAARPQVQLPPFAICSAPGDQVSPVLTRDAAGGVFIAWIDQRDGSIVAHHVVGPWALDQAWPPEGLVLAAGPANRTDLRMCRDGAGGAIVVWEDDTADSAKVYAQHVPASGVRDRRWPEGGLSLCDGPGDHRRPAIDFDGISGAVVAWEERGRSDSVDIYAQRVRSTGKNDWAKDGLAVEAGGPDATGPSVVSDMAGGAIIAYKSPPPMEPPWYDVRVRHVLPAGDVDRSWPPEGLGVVGWWKSEVGMVPDGTGGGWIPFLPDVAQGRATGLFANHVLPSGTLAESRGVGSTRIKAGMLDPTISPDGLGGVTGAWVDCWYTEWPTWEWHYELHAAPSPYWGFPPPTFTGAKPRSPVVVGDGEGGTIVAWLADSGPGNLYVDHVLPSGLEDPASPTGGRWVSGAPASPQLLMLDGGGAYLAWQVNNGSTGWDIHGAWLAGPQPTDVLASVVSAEATAECVRVVWQCGSRAGVTATVYASESGTEWTVLGVERADGQGMVRYEDRAARSGSRRGYRLGIRVDGQESYAGETWVQVPELAFALKPVRPNPVREQAQIEFILPRRMPVSLALIDAGGRRVRDLARGEFDAGEQAIGFTTRDGAGRALAAGLYFLRLDGANGRLVTRVVVMP